MKTILMSSVALVLAVSTPSFAGPGAKANRAEMEATRQLNRHAAQAATPAVAPAQAGRASDAMAMPPSAAPTTRVETASMNGAPLSSISNPPSRIATANVLDSSGTIVGAVQKVEVTPQGRPTRVSVALIGKDEQVIVLDADAVSYDPGRNQITTHTTADQMKAMPGRS